MLRPIWQSRNTYRGVILSAAKNLLSRAPSFQDLVSERDHQTCHSERSEESLPGPAPLTLSPSHSYTFLVDPLREFGRTLLILGAVSVIVGAFLYFGGRLPLRLGRLPGDIIRRGEHTTFYFPIVTCLVISIILSILFWIFSNFRH